MSSLSVQHLPTGADSSPWGCVPLRLGTSRPSQRSQGVLPSHRLHELPLHLRSLRRTTRASSSSATAASEATTGASSYSSFSSSSRTAHESSSASACLPSLEDLQAMTLYELLGIPRTGSQAEIRGAYRHLARRYHPDVRHTLGLSLEESTQRFLQVQEAYEILSDPQCRAMYDFEMVHGRKRMKGPRTNFARATWKPKRRAREGQVLWETQQDEVAVKAAWRQQWQNQMGGLHSRQQPKAGSWAARMREQALQPEDGQHNHEEQDKK